MSISSTKQLFISSIAILGFASLNAGQGLVQAVKPQISELPGSSMPRGCGYSLDDWKGVTLVWAPYQYEGNSQAINLLMVIDGEIRELPINSRDESRISAYDGRYYVDIRTPKWKRVDSELSQAKATLLVRDTKAFIETKIIARASQGC
jgi:hypothetical protein